MDKSNDYLIDEATLGGFIDELIKNKPLPLNSPEEPDAFRTKSMHELDDRIGLAIFGSLNEEQGQEFDRILDADNDSPEPYEEFFSRIGLDVEKIITDVAKQYAEEFLKGDQNA